MTEPPPKPMRKTRAGLTILELVFAVAATTLVVGGGVLALRSVVGSAGASMRANVAQGGTSTLASALEKEMERGETLMFGMSRADDFEVLRIRDRAMVRAPAGTDIRSLRSFPDGSLFSDVALNGPVAVINATGDVLFTNARSTAAGALELDCSVTIPASDTVDIVTFESVRFRLAEGRVLAQSAGEVLELGSATTLRFAPRDRGGDTHPLGPDYAQVPLLYGDHGAAGVNFDLTYRVGEVDTSGYGRSNVGALARRVWTCGEYSPPIELYNGRLNVTAEALGTHDEARTNPVVRVLNTAGTVVHTVSNWTHLGGVQVGVNLDDLPQGDYRAEADGRVYAIEGDTVPDGVRLLATITGRPQHPVFVSRMHGAAINVAYRYQMGQMRLNSNTAAANGVLTLLATNESFAASSGLSGELKPGRYRFTAGTVAGRGAPVPAVQELFVRSGRVTEITVTYPELSGGFEFRAIGAGSSATGRLQSRFGWPPAIDMGVNGNLAYGNLPAGDYLFEAYPVSGWDGPFPNQVHTVTIPTGGVGSVTVEYRAGTPQEPPPPPPGTGTGTLRISIVGTSQTVSGGGTRPDGVAVSWSVSGTMDFAGRAAGTYTITAPAISGLTGPSPSGSQTVTVPNGGMGQVTFTYGGGSTPPSTPPTTPPPGNGTLQIVVQGAGNNNPPGSVSGPVSTSINGSATLSVPPGTYSVTMAGLAYFEGPSPAATQSGTVTSGATRTLTFTYAAEFKDCWDGSQVPGWSQCPPRPSEPTPPEPPPYQPPRTKTCPDGRVILEEDECPYFPPPPGGGGGCPPPPTSCVPVLDPGNSVNPVIRGMIDRRSAPSLGFGSVTDGAEGFWVLGAVTRGIRPGRMFARSA